MIRVGLFYLYCHTSLAFVTVAVEGVTDFLSLFAHIRWNVAFVKPFAADEILEFGFHTYLTKGCV